MTSIFWFVRKGPEIARLLGALNLAEPAARVRLQDSIAQIDVEAGWQHAVVEAGRTASRDGSEIGTCHRKSLVSLTKTQDGMSSSPK